MNTLVLDKQVIDKKEQLSEIFRAGCKTTQKLGVEYERLAVNNKTFKATEFFFENGILDFLQCLKNTNSYIPNYEDNILIGLISEFQNITLEPGAQVEASFKPFEYISDIEKHINVYNAVTAKIANNLGISFLALGVHPVSTYENIKIIPKARYRYMTKYLREQATLPYVMMRETAGVQLSIDYSSEEDAILKLSTALKLSPFLSILFSNSPIRNGKLTGYKSFRANAWLNTDAKRCGLISSRLFQQKPDFTFEDYVEILLDLPMIFNKSSYLGEKTFGEFFAKKGHVDISDWETHISLFFPDVRLKNYIEIRNHDCVPTKYALALPAIYKGIMYGKNGLIKVNELLHNLSYYDYEFIRHNGVRFGLDLKIKNKKIIHIINEIVNIASEELKELCPQEEKYLEPVYELLNDKTTPADIIIKNFEGSWHKDISKLIDYSKIKL